MYTDGFVFFDDENPLGPSGCVWWLLFFFFLLVCWLLSLVTHDVCILHARTLSCMELVVLLVSLTMRK